MIYGASIRRSLGQFRTHPLRTFLTLLGMVFGVGSLVAMVSIGEGAQQEIISSIEAMGADLAHIKAKPVKEEEVGDIINDSLGLNRNDVPAIRAVLPGIRSIAYRARIDLGITDLKVSRHSIDVLAVSEDIFTVHKLNVAEGRKLLRIDHLNRHRVAVLGAELARRAFPDGALGEIFHLEYAYFTVVGVLQARTATENLPVDPEIYNNAVLIPFETAAEELRPPKTYGEIDLISLRVDSTSLTLAAKQALIPILKSLHGGVTDFEVVAPEEILRQKKAAQSVLNIVLISIAAISLLVGGIGVMNIMLANIMERVTEIGLRRALGATKKEIRNQFLTEAVLICFVGGLIGIVLGFAISFTVAWAVDLPIAFAWESMLVSFVVSAIVGVTFGIVPAMQAANTNPIEALQNE